VLLH
jgi:hypothetical protein